MTAGADWPTQEWDIDGGGETLHVRADGDPARPSLLMLHGLLGSMRWFDRVVPMLLPSLRVVRIDLAGFGRSTDHQGGRGPEDQARLVMNVMQELRVQPVATLGHSLGATIAVALAEGGFATGDLIVLSEGPDYTVANPPRVNTVLRAPLIGPLLWKRLPDSALRNGLAGFFAAGFDLEGAFDDRRRPLLDARRVSHRTFATTQGTKERYAAVKPLDARIASLGTRSLVLFGPDDDTFDAAVSIARYDRLPHVRTALVPGTGHSPMLEDPATTARHVVEFLTRSSNETGT
ncbi:alpha/beta fold hydrolase [Kineococcus sp. GCM10028916]|uniref:alpha/beta fold hydrolase n=1 Tax=Kineococcus sp. GCM10028916 TaxID=3273394 RepID=UPI003638025B